MRKLINIFTRISPNYIVFASLQSILIYGFINKILTVGKLIHLNFLPAQNLSTWKNLIPRLEFSNSVKFVSGDFAYVYAATPIDSLAINHADQEIEIDQVVND